MCEVVCCSVALFLPYIHIPSQTILNRLHAVLCLERDNEAQGIFAHASVYACMAGEVVMTCLLVMGLQLYILELSSVDSIGQMDW